MSVTLASCTVTLPDPTLTDSLVNDHGEKASRSGRPAEGLYSAGGAQGTLVSEHMACLTAWAARYARTLDTLINRTV